MKEEEELKLKPSKILKIIGAGEADEQRLKLQSFGELTFLENHYIETK